MPRVHRRRDFSRVPIYSQTLSRKFLNQHCRLNRAGSQPSTGQIGQATPIVNKTGNLILKVLLGLIVIGGFIFIYRNEKYHFMPSNKVREVLAQSVKPIIDREAIARKIDQLSPESQLELERLLNDPAQAEQILRNLNKDIDE